MSYTAFNCVRWLWTQYDAFPVRRGLLKDNGMKLAFGMSLHSSSAVFGAMLLLLAGYAMSADEKSVAPGPHETSGPEGPVFPIWEIRVSGNSLIADSDIERIVYEHMGPERRFEHIEQARGALERSYRDRGYAQVQVYIPVQSGLESGVVQIAVAEPKIANTWVTGARYFSPRTVKKQLPALNEGNVIAQGAVNAQLTSVNRRNADLKVIPVLRPGQAPGTVEVELKVKDDLPLHADIELNNQHSEDTTDLRLKASVSYGNLWQADHKAVLLGVISPEATEEVQVLSANYLMPVGDSRDKLLLYALTTDSSVQTLGDLTVIGSGVIAGGGYIHPLDNTDSLFHSLMFGAEFRDLENKDVFDTKKLEFLALSVGWMGRKIYESGAATDFDLGLRFGMSGLINDESAFNINRRGARAGFMVGNVSLQHERPALMNSSLHGRFRLQYSPSPLITNLQMSSGGVSSVRGYFESQVLADNGLELSLEWHTPDQSRRLGGMLGGKGELIMYGFVDAAWLWDREPYVTGERQYNISSVGVGSRLKAFDGLYAALDMARATTTEGSVAEDDLTTHFKIGYKF